MLRKFSAGCFGVIILIRVTKFIYEIEFLGEYNKWEPCDGGAVLVDEMGFSSG